MLKEIFFLALTGFCSVLLRGSNTEIEVGHIVKGLFSDDEVVHLKNVYRKKLLSVSSKISGFVNGNDSEAALLSENFKHLPQVVELQEDFFRELIKLPRVASAAEEIRKLFLRDIMKLASFKKLREELEKSLEEALLQKILQQDHMKKLYDGVKESFKKFLQTSLFTADGDQ